MEILGVGPMELIFILLIALIVLGPEDMTKAGKTVGRMMRKVVMSPTWHAMQQTSRELRTLPNRLIREAGLDEIERELNVVKDTTKELRQDFDRLSKSTLPQRAATTGPDEELHTIHPGYGAWTQPPASKPAASPEPASPDKPADDE